MHGNNSNARPPAAPAVCGNANCDDIYILTVHSALLRRLILIMIMGMHILLLAVISFTSHLVRFSINYAMDSMLRVTQQIHNHYRALITYHEE